MRIVSGKWAGVSLVSPGSRVRPTRESVRVAWLSELEPELAGARVLDLFAGTGALGLEALSRGARSIDFVENGKPSLHSLKANIAKLRVTNRVRLFKKDVFQFLSTLETHARDDRIGANNSSSGSGFPYAVVLADPPYTSRAADRLVTLWLERPFSGILSVEHAPDRSLPGKGKRKQFQDSAISIYRSRKRQPGDRS
ncbi:MAG: methyltransferase [Gemmatimonadetes bacterium]|nr:RsmD family RNA methyltransferase [Gemmatimonadota bacterium]NNM06620.1 methyltransferase [Gemmatimonadota bacterium]